jgi:peptide chain release factor 3
VSGNKTDLDNFSSENKQHIATDHDNDLVFLTRLQWDIDRVERDYPQIHLSATKEMMS